MADLFGDEIKLLSHTSNIILNKKSFDYLFENILYRESCPPSDEARLKFINCSKDLEEHGKEPDLRICKKCWLNYLGTKERIE